MAALQKIFIIFITMLCSCVISAAAGAAGTGPAEITGEGYFFKNATPEQVRALLKGVSLAGVSTPQGKLQRKITPLMRAAALTPYPKVIDILVEAGCGVNDLALPLWREEDEVRLWDTERTALHFAAQNRIHEVLKRLLEYWPDIDLPAGSPNEFTALHIASRNRATAKNFIVLLEAGANPYLCHPGYRHPHDEAMPLWQNFIGKGAFHDYEKRTGATRPK